MNGTVLRPRTKSLGMYGVIVDSGTDMNILPCGVIEKITQVFNSYC